MRVCAAYPVGSQHIGAKLGAAHHRHCLCRAVERRANALCGGRCSTITMASVQTAYTGHVLCCSYCRTTCNSSTHRTCHISSKHSRFSH